jgi:NADH:ubiquinone oxidoreductase subunit E
MSACAVNPATIQPASLTLDQVRARMARHQPTIDELLRRYPTRRAVLLQVLHLVQGEYGWVPRIGIEWAAEVAACSAVHAFGVVEFYTMYRQVPAGRHLVQVCQTMCCHIQGAEDLIAHLEKTLGIHSGETTADGLFTLARVECLALCGSGPGVMIDDQAIGPKPHRLGQGTLNEGWLDVPYFHPDAANLDAWIAFLRADAQAQGWSKDKIAAGTPAQEHCAVGRLVLNTKGHPQGVGASAKTLDGTYAPPAPALNVKAAATGSAIAITWANDPGAAKLVVERSDDAGNTWRELASVGPKDQKAADTLAEGTTAHYRVISHEKTRSARPSAVVSATGAAAPAPAPVAPTPGKA